MHTDQFKLIVRADQIFESFQENLIKCPDVIENYGDFFGKDHISHTNLDQFLTRLKQAQFLVEFKNFTYVYLKDGPFGIYDKKNKDCFYILSNFLDTLYTLAVAVCKYIDEK